MFYIGCIIITVTMFCEHRGVSLSINEMYYELQNVNYNKIVHL